MKCWTQIKYHAQTQATIHWLTPDHSQIQAPPQTSVSIGTQQPWALWGGEVLCQLMRRLLLAEHEV